jgi:hypothetical protein
MAVAASERSKAQVIMQEYSYLLSDPLIASNVLEYLAGVTTEVESQAATQIIQVIRRPDLKRPENPNDPGQVRLKIQVDDANLRKGEFGELYHMSTNLSSSGQHYGEANPSDKPNAFWAWFSADVEKIVTRYMRKDGLPITAKFTHLQDRVDPALLVELQKKLQPNMPPEEMNIQLFRFAELLTFTLNQLLDEGKEVGSREVDKVGESLKRIYLTLETNNWHLESANQEEKIESDKMVALQRFLKEIGKAVK